MKTMLVVALAVFGSTIAGASTLQDALLQRVGKYVASVAKPAVKGACICEDGTSAAGWLYLSEHFPGPGKVEITVECQIPGFDVVDGGFLGSRICDEFAILAK